MEFAIPVRCTRKVGDVEEVAYGWVSPFMYSNSGLGAATARELNGWRMLEAGIERSPNEWVDNSETSPGGLPLLALKMDLPKSMGSGTTWSTVIKIVDGNPMDNCDDPRERKRVRQWAQAVRESVEVMARKTHNREGKTWKNF